MRLFIAVDVPDEVKDYLHGLQKRLHSLPAKIKWVAKKQLHLTLKFLGEVEEGKVEVTKEKLRNVKLGRFSVKLNGLGVFPSESYVRVVWAGLEPEGKFIELQQKVDAELLELFPKEQKFHAHLTLGRVKFVKDKEEFSKMLEETKVEEKEFEVSNFKLMKSTLTGKGPVYEELEVF